MYRLQRDTTLSDRAEIEITRDFESAVIQLRKKINTVTEEVGKQEKYATDYKNLKSKEEELRKRRPAPPTSDEPAAKRTTPATKRSTPVSKTEPSVDLMEQFMKHLASTGFRYHQPQEQAQTQAKGQIQTQEQAQTQVFNQTQQTQEQVQPPPTQEQVQTKVLILEQVQPPPTQEQVQTKVLTQTQQTQEQAPTQQTQEQAPTQQTQEKLPSTPQLLQEISDFLQSVSVNDVTDIEDVNMGEAADAAYESRIEHADEFESPSAIPIAKIKKFIEDYNAGH